MIDHIGLSVTDFEKSGAFYNHALAPLGITMLMAFTAEQTGSYPAAGFGSEGKPYFWLGTGKPVARSHVAFTAKTHAEVDAFYAAAIKAGGTDNGPPGPRPHYHQDYYGAFVLDLDGHNIEALCRTPA